MNALGAVWKCVDWFGLLLDRNCATSHVRKKDMALRHIDVAIAFALRVTRPHLSTVAVAFRKPIRRQPPSEPVLVTRVNGYRLQSPLMGLPGVRQRVEVLVATTQILDPVWRQRSVRWQIQSNRALHEGVITERKTSA